MTAIKITSNPYENTVVYAKQSIIDQSWSDIADDPLYKGKLVTATFATGFFPFKVNEIVDELIEEYGSDKEPLNLVFEGSDDEFESLKVACSEDSVKDMVELTRSSKYLSNAREIIQDVVSIFGELDPLIRESTEDKASAIEDLDKISEASSNIVPICVLGNYSSGKSTFINALIGAEYLPSAAKPLTAKAYRITRRLQSSGAAVRFKLDGSRQIELNFDETRFLQSGLTKGEPLLEELEAKLRTVKTDTLVERVNRAIMVINDFERDSDKRRISDMVEVEVPFSDTGLLGASENEYVIFDTPGSNSASQRNHMDVLRKALEGMSNGIPVFVSVYDQLDSDDADELSEQIKQIKGLDSRFTMIVVSKADQAGLPEDGFDELDVTSLKKQAVVSKLYSNGLYFVSSLMGLGAKNNEVFIDSNLRRHFVQQRSAYGVTEDEFYTQLYQYNIMPRQMKRESARAAELIENPIFANSGLFCVEYEIENFSEKYAAYNKCRQMAQALEKAYARATADTEAEIRNRERTRDMLGEKLDADTRSLILSINTTGKQLRNEAERGYPPHMEDLIAKLRSHKTRTELKDIESEINTAQKQLMNLGGEEADVVEAWGSLLRGLKRNLKSIAENKDASSLVTARDDMARGLASVAKELGEVGETKANIARATVDELLNNANEKVGEEIDTAKNDLDEFSRQYWVAQSENLKNEYSRIIAGTSALSESSKKRLADQIVKFDPIEFESSVVFSKEDFALKALDIVAKRRLARAYNQAVNDAVTAIAGSLQLAHTTTFVSWADSLEAMIVGNVTELSPALHEQAELIAEHNARIKTLGERQAKLESLVLQVKAKIDWKFFEMTGAQYGC